MRERESGFVLEAVADGAVEADMRRPDEGERYDQSVAAEPARGEESDRPAVECAALYPSAPTRGPARYPRKDTSGTSRRTRNSHHGSLPSHR